MKNLSIFARSKAKQITREHIRLANEARDAHDWAKAAAHYSEALKFSPGLAEIWIQYGHSLKERGAIEDAREAYSKALELGRETVDTHIHIGNLKKMMGDLNGARHHLERAVELDALEKSTDNKPSLPSSVCAPWIQDVSLGDMARDLSQWQQSTFFYRRALKTNEKLTGIWIQLGHSLKESGDYQEAEEAYYSALRLEARSPEIHLQLGHLMKVQGNLSEASKHYSQSLALDCSNTTLAADAGEIRKTVVMRANVSLEQKEIKERPSPELYSINNLIENAYIGVLGRPPEPKAFEVYGPAFESGMTLSDLIKELIDTQEFAGQQATEFTSIIRSPLEENTLRQDFRELVRVGYRSILDRPAEQEGINIYSNALNNGMSLEAFISEFVAIREAEAMRRKQELNVSAIQVLRETLEMAEIVLLSFLAERGIEISFGRSNREAAQPNEILGALRTCLLTIAKLNSLEWPRSAVYQEHVPAFTDLRFLQA